MTEKKHPLGSSDLRNQVLVDYMPLVTFEARRMSERLPASVDCDDLISAGALGLIDAFNKFDASRSVKFKTYAVFRIRGAMLDFLRENDSYSRTVRNFARDLRMATEQFTLLHGRTPSLLELAAAMGQPAEQLSRRMASLPSGSTIEIDGVNDKELKISEDLNAGSGDDDLTLSERRDALAELIRSTLSEREQLVLQLYFWDDLNLKEIAKILEVTESRVSQILSQAKRRMKAKLKKNEVFNGAA